MLERSAISFVREASDGPVSVALQRAYFADIAQRYPGWSPEQIPSADPAEVALPTGAWVVAYLGGPGATIRCRDCEQVLIRVAEAGGRIVLDLRGCRTITFG